MQTFSPNSVSTAYAADGVGPMVYGKYKERGYAVNPLTAQVGTLVPENVSASEAFRIAGLNWTAEKRPVYFLGSDGPVQDDSMCSIVRSDTDVCLGIHGSGYTPVQNSALVRLLEYLREDIDIETVLSIRNGRKVFASASIKTEGEVVPGDRVRRYLHLFNSHDGSSGFGVFFSDIRLRCANQLTYLTGRAAGRAAASGAGLRRKHTHSVTAFAEQLPHLIDLERRTFSESLSSLRALASVRLTSEAATRILSETFADKLAVPIRDKQSKELRPRTLNDLPEVEIIRSHYRGGTGYGTQLEGIEGTVYGFYNAITQYYTHDAGTKKDSTERARARLEALWGGKGAQGIERARVACMSCI